MTEVGCSRKKLVKGICPLCDTVIGLSCPTKPLGRRVHLRADLTSPAFEEDGSMATAIQANVCNACAMASRSLSSWARRTESLVARKVKELGLFQIAGGGGLLSADFSRTLGIPGIPPVSIPARGSGGFMSSSASSFGMPTSGIHNGASHVAGAGHEAEGTRASFNTKEGEDFEVKKRKRDKEDSNDANVITDSVSSTNTKGPYGSKAAKVDTIPSFTEEVGEGSQQDPLEEPLEEDAFLAQRLMLLILQYVPLKYVGDMLLRLLSSEEASRVAAHLLSGGSASAGGYALVSSGEDPTGINSGNRRATDSMDSTMASASGGSDSQVHHDPSNLETIKSSGPKSGPGRPAATKAAKLESSGDARGAKGGEIHSSVEHSGGGRGRGRKKSSGRGTADVHVNGASNDRTNSVDGLVADHETETNNENGRVGTQIVDADLAALTSENEILNPDKMDKGKREE
uniref:Uncharacterized protein n=1 Tax=Polytomella parva TaxID=51329 RepID=A0A7S0VFH4_9CHLO|mmetsp:Transcript_492/g.579  ORF Transcript_492/g.579 Transcript_492/m.579 type:complete len:458 (+) Transcript_492:181-1554(+)|eukprot:CAMPEP_0175058614 /NCGR_PEP_ID=MMETSP0052_2-20121109/11952_1 /TAXON_ID=51329 ORGANISM="Polytomella parva, Strain SAG 63-3" /NCGR_SAMPLE_ID=MMETSP0052_2 /ASSEMBLY_ACC=CAM_ASM_000194 /LENGTH=457 /DNA_ID=CAMNT_0016324027 /DNA_START=74 /DNA_END=1447 /DNA_ORIENTATION=+